MNDLCVLEGYTEYMLQSTSHPLERPGHLALAGTSEEVD